MSTFEKFALFVLWAEQQVQFPTATVVAERYAVGMMTAYRWRIHYARASGRRKPRRGELAAPNEPTT